MKKFKRILASLLMVVMLLSFAVVSRFLGFKNPITESFSTKATAASYLSVDEAARYASMFYEAGSSSYELACLALTGQQQGSPETWASIAEGISLFAGISNEVNWDNLLCDASDITTSNITHITGAISGMFDIMDSIDNIKESESALRTSYEGLKIVKGLFDVFGKGSCFPSTLSLIMVSVDATLCVAGFLAQANFQESLTLYEAELLIEYSTGLPLTYQTITKPNPGSSLSAEETQQAFDVIYFKYLSKRMIDNIGGGSSGGESSEVPVEDVSLPLSRCTIFNNQTPTIAATVYPSNATNKTITYSSSDTSIATVSSEGVITPISGMYGKVTIYATAHNGVRESCEITVLPFLAIKTGDSCQIVSYIGSGGVVEIPSQVNIYKITSIGTSAFKDNNKITKIIIPDSVVNIESSAFYGCKNLSEVKIGTGIEAIKKAAFYECVNLTKITINGNLVSVGDYAFAYCEKLSEIRFPNSVESLGECAFYDCSSLASVTLGNNIKSIGKDAFRDCVALTEVIIPDCVTDIDERAFSGCKQLSKVKFGAGIKKIGEGAFYGCSSLVEVIIGTEIKTIEKGAFYECVNLVKVEINGNLENVNDYTFAYCEKLLEITLPNSVESIGEAAFHRCSSLKSVMLANKVSIIGPNAFSYCDALVEITIPNSVINIGDYAFYKCSSLKELTMPVSTKICNSEYTFGGCVNIEKIILTKGNGSSQNYTTEYDENGEETYVNYTPWYISGCSTVIIDDGVKEIPPHIFIACTKLEYVSIGNSVTNIGDSAFNNCISLTSVEISDSVTSIGGYAFFRCQSLTSIEIPDSVISIGRNAFYDCASLTSVTIGNSVTSIGDYAFYGCSGLENITISDSVASIGVCAFQFCSNLESVIIPASITSISAFTFQNCDSLTSVIIPDSVTNIGDYAFQYCDNLASIKIGKNVTTIGENAFEYCESLDRITIPDSVTTLGSEAFKDCIRLEEINIGSGITEIGYRLFYNCDNLISVTIPSTVTSIGNYAFYSCNQLAIVTLGDSVTNFGWMAFYNCPNMTTIYYTGSVVGWCTISKDFANYDYLYIDGILIEGDFVIPDDVTSIRGSVFRGYDKITSITIPDSVKSIGALAFYNCDSLTSVTIGKGVTNIESGAFRDCDNLLEINVERSNTAYFSDEYGVLFNKDKSELIQYPTGNNTIGYTIPKSVTNIDYCAFYSCDSLAYVIIFDSVVGIEDDAFSNCNSLTDVYYLGTQEQWDLIDIYSSDDSNANLLNSKIHFCTKVAEQLPTCGFYGYTEGLYCVDCAEYVVGHYTIDATGAHDYSDWIVEVVPTAIEMGAKKRVCSGCGVCETEELVATGFETSEGVTIDFETNTMSGFNAGETSLDGYTMPVNDGYTWSYETSNGKLGTGSKAILKDGDIVIGEYTILIYGDTTGDSWYDGQDAVIVSCLANGMLTKEDVSEAVYTAADCNHDGVIDEADVALLNEAGTLLANVDQTKPAEVLLETSSEYVEYISLIDQSPEIETEDETDIPEADVEDTPEADTEDAKIDVFEMILNFIKSIFEMLLSYIPMPLK